MMNVLTERRSIEFLKQPSHWPRYPACPVKRMNGQGKWPDMGIVFDGDFTVYRVNLFGFTQIELDLCRKHKYGSLEAMVADGWEVD